VDKVTLVGRKAEMHEQREPGKQDPMFLSQRSTA